MKLNWRYVTFPRFFLWYLQYFWLKSSDWSHLAKYIWLCQCLRLLNIPVFLETHMHLSGPSDLKNTMTTSREMFILLKIWRDSLILVLRNVGTAYELYLELIGVRNAFVLMCSGLLKYSSLYSLLWFLC